MRDLFSRTSHGSSLSLNIPSHKTKRDIKGLQEIEHLIQSTALQQDLSCPLVVGVDEAGRGPWAGPVVAAAVIFPFELSKDLAYGRVNAQTKRLQQLNDSKKLSEQRRLALMEPISQLAIGIGVGIADPREIEELNIMQANYRAMRTAITEALEQVKTAGLSSSLPHLVLVDGSHKIPKLSLAQEAIIKGDQRSYHIAAASIIAKVTRDQIMQEADLEFPGYGFAQHKGYGTKAHQKALQEKGVCLIHRRNYKPIKALIDD
ncbi:MAG: ribonuclease HII [Myxococcales bacterium]|nr:ribonuclease HII [Myxococcales bacterium]